MPKRRKQIHRGRITAPQYVADTLAVETGAPDPHNLRGAAHRAVDDIPRTPIAKLNRSIKRNPALKELSQELQKAMKEQP